MQTHKSALVVLDDITTRTWEQFTPPLNVRVSEWSRRFRVLPKGTTSRPGPFRPEKFQVEMMDAITDPAVHEVVCMKSTQVGWSDAVLNNIVGYYIDIDPKPMMLVQPTHDNARDYGRKRITPMIAASPVLRTKVKEAASRRSGNTLALKEFPGGFLKLTGANSGSGLRSDPVPIVLFDEVDGYPLDVDGEGDPIAIGTRRTDAYHDYKILKGSTPARPKGFSRIESDYEHSDKRRFFVPCPFCGFRQVLWWRDPGTKEYRLLFEVDADRQIIADSVRYICQDCRRGIPEVAKQQMLDQGEWVAEFPLRPVVGFHLNALYSPWRENWTALAQEWEDANHEKNPEKLKAFVNLRLGETWEEAGEVLEGHVLKSRRETYSADIPKGVGLLTAAVDVQNDRLEVAVKGWGEGEESWLIAYQQFFGDPGTDQVWSDLDEFLDTEFEADSGKRARITATLIDSGGLHTENVYRFVKPRQHRRIFCLKGSSEQGKPIIAGMSQNNAYRVRLFSIGTDTAKDKIFSRLRIPAPAAGFVHLPDWVDDEYLEQLTSEKAVTHYKRGRGMVREYIKRRARNEALDLEVYALAALYLLGGVAIRKLGELAEKLQESDDPEAKQVRPGQMSAAGQAAGRQTIPRTYGVNSSSGWVDGWR
jgi:phage terminase large subunit GpA-like protein